MTSAQTVDLVGAHSAQAGARQAQGMMSVQTQVLARLKK